MMKNKIPSAIRAGALAVSLASFHPMLEGCANLPPVGNPRPDAGVIDGGTRDAGRGWAFDGGISLPDSGPNCPDHADRLYVGGGAIPFNGELFVLESAAGYNAEISISDTASGTSTFVSIPQWGSQAIKFAGKTFTIFVNETSDASPSWADVDIYGC